MSAGNQGHGEAINAGIQEQREDAGQEHSEAAAGEHGEGLLHVFRARAISLRSMDRPLRLITGLALAQLLVAAVLIAARDRPMSAIAVFAQEHQLVQMPQPVFWVSVIFLVLAWSYLLAGALHAHWAVRLVGLALFTAAVRDVHDVAGLRPAWSLASTTVLVATWAVGLSTWWYDRRAARRGAREEGHCYRLKMSTFGLLLVLVLALYGIAWWSNGTVASRLFALAMSAQLTLLSLFLIPVLFLAGVDFAEWGEVAAGRVAALAQRARSPLPLAVPAALVAAGILANLARQAGWGLLPQVAIGLVAGGFLLLLAHLALGFPLAGWRPRRGRLPPLPSHGQVPHAHVPYRVLVVSALVFMLVLFAGSVATVLPGAGSSAASRQDTMPLGGALTMYRHTRQPRFSIAYPSFWEVAPLLDVGPRALTVFAFKGAGTGDPATFFVVTLPRRLETTPDQFLADWLQLCCRKEAFRPTLTRVQDPWRVTRFTLNPSARMPFVGIAWQRSAGDRLWLLYGLTPPRLYSLHLPIFTAMRASWTPTGAAPAAQAAAAAGATTGDRLLAVAGVVWLLVTLVAAALLAVWVRRGRGDLPVVAGLFVLLVSLLFVLRVLPQLASVFVGLAPGRVPYLAIPGIQALVASATLLALAWLAVRRGPAARVAPPLACLFTLNVALQVLAWVYGLYDRAMDVGGRFSVAQAVVIVLALLWDVTMSGEGITNVHGRFFPRHARVLLFLGYIMLVSSAVLYFSSLHVQATGARVEPLFESEQWPQFGLVDLGLPLLLTLFLLRLARWAAQTASRAGTAAGPAHHDGGHPAPPKVPAPVADQAGGAAAQAPDGAGLPQVAGRPALNESDTDAGKATFAATVRD